MALILSLFCLIWILLPWLSFHFHLHKISFSIPFTFNLSMCDLSLKWIFFRRQQIVGSKVDFFHRQHIVGSCFTIQSSTLCLCVGALTLKIIIDGCVFIAILNIVFQQILYFFFVPFFFFWCSLFWFDDFSFYYAIFSSFCFLWIYCLFLICGCPIFQVC